MSSLRPRSSGVVADGVPKDEDAAARAVSVGRVAGSNQVDVSEVVDSRVPVLLERSRKLSHGSETGEPALSTAAATIKGVVGRAGAGVMRDGTDTLEGKVAVVGVGDMAMLTSEITLDAAAPVVTGAGTDVGTPPNVGRSRREAC